MDTSNKHTQHMQVCFDTQADSSFSCAAEKLSSSCRKFLKAETVCNLGFGFGSEFKVNLKELCVIKSKSLGATLHDELVCGSVEFEVTRKEVFSPCHNDTLTCSE